jgi:DNA (cytosine-5)-methyltransferase 1
MRYLSVCSGIEAASVAWRDLEMEPVAFSEIEPFPCALLAHHYPTVPNWGDMTKFKEWPDAAIDLLVGGTPCQAFSVAGLRQGLADPRGNLTLTFLAVAERYRPEWILWENVPGVLSIDAGRTFGSFLGGLGELGYGFAYRVLDAQYFGVAQRRRRVFVVAHARDWRRAAAVLFDGESVSGNPPPSRKAREGAPGGAPAGARGGRGVETAGTVLSKTGRLQIEDTLVPTSLEGDETVPSLVASLAKAATGSTQDGALVAVPDRLPPATFHPRLICGSESSNQVGIKPDALSLTSEGTREGTGNFRVSNVAISTAAVRRLTPTECERLQGFPDRWTAVPYRGKPAADGVRYKALGNSMAVPVIGWLGRRLCDVGGEKE